MIRFMGELERDTVWQGEVHVIGDVLVPAGTTLRIESGTHVQFAERPRWACSVFWRSPSGDSVEATVRECCDLVVSGRLDVLGTRAMPVLLGVSSAPWGGITCFARGTVWLREAVLDGARQCSVRLFDDASLVGENSRCSGSEYAIWAWGTSRVSWNGGSIRATRGSILCCEGSRAHLVEVEDASPEGIAATDWTLVRVDRGRFSGPRRHCVVARHRSWVKLRGCSTTNGAVMDIVRQDEAHVEVAA